MHACMAQAHLLVVTSSNSHPAIIRSMEQQESCYEVVSLQQETGAQEQAVESSTVLNMDVPQPNAEVQAVAEPSTTQQQADMLQATEQPATLEQASSTQQGQMQAFTLSVSVPQPAAAQEVVRQSQELQVPQPEAMPPDNSIPSVGYELSALDMVQDGNTVPTAAPACQIDLQEVLRPHVVSQTQRSDQKTSRAPQMRHLTFYTWWFEDTECSDLSMRVTTETVGGGLTKYHCTIQFDIVSKAFSIKTAAGNQRLAVDNLHDVKSALGLPLDWWDLHVGASIIILGRKVTLLKADGPTATWIDQHAKRLHKLRDELQTEVQKYKPRALPAAVTFNRGSRLDVGGMAVRNMVMQIHALLDHLCGFRPQRVVEYQERLTMLGAS